ncbi:hypothetical protein PU01_24415 [Hafnia alvei]|nr:hypothetical protein PU01_24415 [Hafnia alvei]PNK70630.1 hypothetical protein A6J69_000520 [Hafnia paralvei]
MINKWRNNKTATIAGFPIAGVFPYLFLIYVPSLTLFFLITFINVFYTVLYHLGYSPLAFFQRVISKIRGPIVYSRPWWVRERWNKK